MGGLVVTTYKLKDDLDSNGETEINSGLPTSNFGNSTIMEVGWLTGVSRKLRGLLHIKLPDAPVPGAILKGLSLDLYVVSRTATIPTIQIYELEKEFVEGTGASGSGADWNTYDGATSWNTAGATARPGDHNIFMDGETISIANGHVFFDLWSFVKYKNLTWGASFNLLLISTVESGGVDVYADFASSEHATDGWRPRINVTHEDPSPTIPVDTSSQLKVEAYELDKTQAKLTWGQPKDDDLRTDSVGTYIVIKDSSPNFNLISPSATARIIGVITSRGTLEFIDDGSDTLGLPENAARYYTVAVCDGGNYIDNGFGGAPPVNSLFSGVTIHGEPALFNEVWVVRPNVSSFTLTGAPPNVKDEVTARVQTSTYPSLPSPTVDSKVIMDWTGEGFETGYHDVSTPVNPLDENGATTGKEYLKHRYFKAVDAPSTITPKVQVINSLGFASDLTSYSSPFSVTSLAPVASLKSSMRESQAFPLHPTAGTVTASIGSATVTGSGTSFLKDVRPKDIIIFEGEFRFFIVKEVESDTRLQLDINSPVAVSGVSYMIVRNATVRLNGEDSIERNGNGTITKFEFRIYDYVSSQYFDKANGQWVTPATFNDTGTTPYIDIPMVRSAAGGTIDVVQGSRTINGNGTAWLGIVNVGDVIMPFGAKAYVIASVVSNTEITLEDIYDEATQSTINYHIFRTRTYNPIVSQTFEAALRVTNSFTKTNTETGYIITSKPQAGIDFLAHVGAEIGTVTLSNPTDGRKKQVDELTDSDDIEVVDEGRKGTTLQINGSVARSYKQDTLESLFHSWVNNDTMLRIFYRKDKNKSYYYETVLQTLPRTHSQSTYFEWNVSLIVLRRVEA